MTDKNSLRRLQLFNFKLNALLEITQAINSNLPVDELLHRYQDILRQHLLIGRILIFKYQNGWDCILNSSDDPTVREIDITEDLIPFPDIRFVTNSNNFHLRNYDFVIPVYNNNSPLAFILIGDIEEEMSGVSPVIKHLHYIQTISNIIIVAIENIRLFNESLKQEVFRKELELASRMQNMLIPKKSTLPANERILVRSYYQPHFEVGGDYFDYIEMGPDEFGFCVADVSGKGISAALLMSNFQAILRALFTKEIPLNVIVERLNERVMSNANYEKFITFFIARYNYQTHNLEYINAGHNPPVLYECVSKKFSLLTQGCVGLGMLDVIPCIQKGYFHVSEPVKILGYTDGLVEFINYQDLSDSTLQLEKELDNIDSVEQNIASIIEHHNISENNNDIFDDITILGVQLF
jgi:sigma-B regulation protein RsbU (phosphoserine phosphatase)